MASGFFCLSCFVCVSVLTQCDTLFGMKVGRNCNGVGTGAFWQASTTRIPGNLVIEDKALDYRGHFAVFVVYEL